MEKIHGTSTWITYENNSTFLKYHSGGENAVNFRALFDDESLKTHLAKIAEENNWSMMKIHGECYGAKQQKMRTTYGNALKFIVFDIFAEDLLKILVVKYQMQCQKNHIFWIYRMLKKLPNQSGSNL